MFSVSPSNTSLTGTGFAFAYTPSVWASIKVNFWASVHSDLQVGNFHVGTSSLISAQLQTGNNNCKGCAEVTTNIVSPFSAGQKPVIRIFLNGFTLNKKSGALQVSAAPTNLQQTTLTIKITMGKLTVLDSVYLSWIAFSPSTSSFVSYGGQVSQNNYAGSNSQDISSTIHQSDYTLYGLNLISITSGKGISFTSNINDDFVLTIGSSIPMDSFSLIYIAVGPLPSQLCGNCGAENIVNGDMCVASCPSNTYTHTYRDGGVACRQCSAELGLVLAGGKCIKGAKTTTTTTKTTVVTNGKKPYYPKPPVRPQPPVVKPQPPVVTPQPPVVTPQPPVVNPQPPVVNPQPPVVNPPTTPEDCPKNSYFNGNQCAC